MNRSTWLGLAAGLHSAVSVAQPAPSDAHQHEPRAVAKSEAPAALRTPPRSGYESAFTDYLRFVADESLKDWRAANEEVGEAARGGAMKAMPAVPSAQPAATPRAKP